MNDEGDLQYYRDLNKSELPSSKRGEVDSYGDDAAAGVAVVTGADAVVGDAEFSDAELFLKFISASICGTTFDIIS